MGTQDTGRKRMPNRERLTAEDDALNLIAREAEARLAAKRAARAEAREIRMKELEWQQNEKKYHGLESKWSDIEQWMEESERYSYHSRRCTSISDDEERMSVGSRGSLRVEDRDKDHLEKGSRAASTLASLSRASSRRGSGDASNWADPETSVREMKDSMLEVEQKYRKAMVFNAQLDNEKSKLMYQVDVLKDSLMELEEQLSESRREYEEKSKAFERERHAHNILQFQFSELKEMLKQSEELLTENRKLSLKQDGYVREIADLQETLEWKDKKIGALERQKEFSDAIQNERDDLRNEVLQLRDTLKKHGIVLGPDLNANGETEGVIDRLTNADSATRSAQDPQTSQIGGDSMLGKATEGQMEGKELQEGGSRELVEKAENHIDEQQRQQEEVESLECSVAESAQQNQGEREPSSPISCSQASVPPTGNPEREQSDSLMGSGLEMHYSQHNSEANFVAQDNYELKVLNGTEGSITKEEEGGDNGVGNADLVDGGMSSTEGQTASLEGGTGIENSSDSTADGNQQETMAPVDQGECESSDKTGDMESENESVRNVTQEDKSNQTSDGTRDMDEEAGAAASVCAEPQPPPAESTDKDQKEECPKESTLIEGGDETAESVSITLKHETADVVLEPKEKQKKGKGMKTAQQQAKRKGVTEGASVQAVTTSSQPENTGASGKKKKKKKKSKQKQKLTENPEEAKQVDEEEQEKRADDCMGTALVKELETDHSTVDPSAEECQTETVEETEIKTLSQALQDDERVDKEETEQEGGNHSEVLGGKNVEETDILAGGIGIKHEVDMPSESSSLLEEETSKALAGGIKHANVENTFSLEAFTEEPIGSDFPKEVQIPQEDPNRSDCDLNKAEGNVQEIQGAQDNLIKYATESEGALLEGTEIEEMDSCEEAEVLVKEQLSEYHKEDQACSEDVELQERVDAQRHVTISKEFATDVLVKDNGLESDGAGQTENLFEEENDSCEEPPECIMEEGAELTDCQNTESISVEPTVPNQVEMVNPSISEKYNEGESKLEEVDLQPKELDDNEEGGESFQFDDDLGLDLEASNTITSRPHEDNSLEEISTNEGKTDEDKEAISGENPDSRPEKESGNGQCQNPSIRDCPEVQDEGNSSADVLGTVKVEQMSDGSQSVLNSVEEGEEAMAFVTGSHSTENQESQPTEEPPEGSEEQVDAGSAKGSKKGKAKGKEDCRMA